MRSEVAQANGTPANLLSGTTQAELVASADALLAGSAAGIGSGSFKLIDLAISSATSR